MNKTLTAVSAFALTMASSLLANAQAPEERQLLWGDTHLHTSKSFDAYMNENLSGDTEMAYQWAKGVPVIHPYTRHRVQIETPLDFLVVADHAELYGVIRHINQKGIPSDDLGIVDRVRAWLAKRWIDGVIEDGEGMVAFVDFLPDQSMTPQEAAGTPNERVGGIPNERIMSKSAWAENIEIADKHYQPGKFTSLIGWEWSSIPGGANLHRVVFTAAGADKAGNIMPYSLADSQYPEDLWQWLDKTSAEQDMEFIAIPHNSNISKGYMFPEVTIKGEPVSAEYAKLRSRWEPVAEMTQIKGDSETHPALSPDDEFADFESYPHYIEQVPAPYNPQAADFARSALKTGLQLEEKLGTNPFKFGMIGATDSHVGLASAEEDNFQGKMAIHGKPENNMKAGISKRKDGPTGWSMSASGLAAVWADKNDRESIMAAFKRREVYATTGPRMAVRMFAGWSFNEADMIGDLAKAGYSKGVPMGGDLTNAPEGQSPTFLIEAVKDPVGGNLDRVQVVKGWLDGDGKTHEKIYDVAWAGDRSKDANGKVPAIGNTVNVATATYTNTIGANVLSTFWSDPDFDPSQRAFYYVRVLQIPTPRHSLMDALALGMETAKDFPSAIQERAYTSPVWFTP